jgi:hypothetical protein
MFATLESDQSCEIDFQSMFMKVIWPTVDTNLGLIRCLQYWHLVSLESKITLKFLVIGCIKILAWDWHSACFTGIVLLQLLSFALRVWLEGWFLGIWSWLSLMSITEVWDPPVSEIQSDGWPLRRSLSWISCESSTSNEQEVVELYTSDPYLEFPYGINA